MRNPRASGQLDAAGPPRLAGQRRQSPSSGATQYPQRGQQPAPFSEQESTAQSRSAAPIIQRHSLQARLMRTGYPSDPAQPDRALPRVRHRERRFDVDGRHPHHAAARRARRRRGRGPALALRRRRPPSSPRRSATDRPVRVRTTPPPRHATHRHAPPPPHHPTGFTAAPGPLGPLPTQRSGRPRRPPPPCIPRRPPPPSIPFDFCLRRTGRRTDGRRRRRGRDGGGGRRGESVETRSTQRVVGVGGSAPRRSPL